MITLTVLCSRESIQPLFSTFQRPNSVHIRKKLAQQLEGSGVNNSTAKFSLGTPHLPADQERKDLRLNFTASAALTHDAHEEVAKAIIEPLDVSERPQDRPAARACRCERPESSSLGRNSTLVHSAGRLVMTVLQITCGRRNKLKPPNSGS